MMARQHFNPRLPEMMMALVLALVCGTAMQIASAQQPCSTASDCQVFPQYEAACVLSQCQYTCGTNLGEGCGPEWTRFVTDFQRNVIAIDEPINWVTRIAGHNATESYAYGASLDPNQSLTVSAQLTAGARVLAIDVHVLDGELWLCHNDLCIEHRERYSDIMEEIGDWLDANPDEFIWITLEYLPYQSCEFLPDGECQDGSMTFEQILDALEDGVRDGLGAARVYRPSDDILAGQDSLGRDEYAHPEFSPYYCSASGNACDNDDTLCPASETCELAYPSSANQQQVRRWATLRELRRESKQVMLLMGGTGGCCGDDCGVYSQGAGVCSAHSTADTAGQSCADGNDCTGLANTLSWIWQDGAFGGYYASRVKSASKDFDYSACEGDGTGHFWDPDTEPTAFPVVGEARTLIDAAADTSGFIEEGDVAALMECNVARISLDFVDAAEDTAPNACAVYIGCENELFGLNDVIPGGFGCLVATCPADDTRILRSAWSWKWGVTPAAADTRVFMNGVDGRWNPTDVENQLFFRCACGHHRVGEPTDWSDKPGDQWAVTMQGAAFKQKPEEDPRDTGQLCQLACQTEHNLDFALPANAYQNRKLYDALIAASSADGTQLTQENVWVRLSRDASGGPWTTSILPWISTLTVDVNSTDPDQRDFTADVENPDGYVTEMLFIGNDGISSSFLNALQVSNTTETFSWTKPFGSEGSFSVEAQLWGHPEPSSTVTFKIVSATVDFDFEFANVVPTIDAFDSLDRSNLTEICADVCIGHLLQQMAFFTDTDADDPFVVRVLYGDADDNSCDIPAGATSGVCTGASAGSRSCTVDTDCGTVVPFTEVGGGRYQFEMTNLYADSGTFDGVIVVDDGTDEALHNFTVSNLDTPVAPEIGGGCSGQDLIEGETFACSPAFTDLNVEDTHTAQVDYGEGAGSESVSVQEINSTGHFVILQNEFETAGTYNVVLTVTDSGGLSDSRTYEVRVEAPATYVPPTIQIVNPDGTTTDGPLFPALNGTEGTPVTRTFRILDDNSYPDGVTWSLSVAWGDQYSEGSVVTNTNGGFYGGRTPDANGNIDVTVSHTYPCTASGCVNNSTGAFGVYVFARAQLGGTEFGPYSVPHTFTVDVSSDNNPPELDGVSTQDATINEGSLFSRTGQTFSDADQNDPWVVYVDYGDGTIDQPTITGKSFDLSHVYRDNGTYKVEVILDDGAATDTRSFEVQVNNVAPKASVGPDQQVAVGDEVAATGTWTDPGDSYDAPYAWTWAIDGVQADGGSANYGDAIPLTARFTTGGSRTLTFEVTDKDGLTNSASLVVAVGGSPPIADAGPDQTLECSAPTGTSATVDGSGSSDPDGGPLDYLWSSSAFGTASSASVTAPFPLGSTMASLTVTDNEDKSTSDDVLIMVEDTLAPSLTVPQDLSLECSSTSGTPADIGQATTSDTCDASPQVSNDRSGLFRLGSTPVTWTVADASSNQNSAVQTVSVADTKAPSLTAPPDLVIECSSPAGTPVAIGNPTVADACDLNPAVSNDAPALFPLGPTNVNWFASDAEGNDASAVQRIELVDRIAPVVAVDVLPSSLWPPNHKMVAVNVQATATDACDSAPVCRIVDVSSNEPANGSGDGNTNQDWVIDGDLSVRLRAERAGGGGGREYYIQVACEDASGGIANATATVTVDNSNSNGKGKGK